MVGIADIDIGPMTVDEFYAFTDTRPDEEKWELIGGEPILNAAPSRLHQKIVKNVIVALENRAREMAASWEVLPGLGVRVSDTDRPEPDVVVAPPEAPSLDPQDRDTGRDTSDVIVAFEVLSPSTKKRDLRWKRTAYPRLASLTHYIAIAQDAVEVIVFAREEDFAGRRLRSLDDAIEIRSLGISLPVTEICHGTGLTAYP
jgi:Uma2 family endonuclease